MDEVANDSLLDDEVILEAPKKKQTAVGKQNARIQDDIVRMPLFFILTQSERVEQSTTHFPIKEQKFVFAFYK